MRIATRADWHCEECKLPAPRGEADHVLPVEMGGASDVENGRWLCVKCHKRKTAVDVGVIRKSDRVRDRNNGTLKAKRPFRAWRKFSGEIVRRDD